MAGSRRTRTTSACRVSDQKPWPGAGSSFQCSGSCSRSSSKSSKARPASKASRSVRSTTATSRPGQDCSAPNEQDCKLAGHGGTRGGRPAGAGTTRSPRPADAEHRTLAETERAVAERLDGLVLDMTAMAAVQNLYRAAGAIRNHLERSVLARTA